MKAFARYPALALLLATATAAGAADAASDPTAAGLQLLVQALQNYLIPLAGASALTVALLEAFKKLMSVQGRFHRSAVVRWLSQSDADVPKVLGTEMSSVLGMVHGTGHYNVRAEMRTAGLDSVTPQPATSLAGPHVSGAQAIAPAPGMPTTAAPVAAPATPPLPSVGYSPDRAYAEFFHLTSGQKMPDKLAPRSDWLHWRGIDRAVFEFEIARMMSQIQDAADTVLNNPEAYQHLYSFFTRGCLVDDAHAWRAFLASSPTQNNQAQSERYARIRLLMRRQLDSFQGVTSSRWDELNQLWAVVVGAVVLLFAQVMTVDPAGPGLSSPIAAILGGFSFAWQHDLLLAAVIRSALGGALAPIAKDVISAISQISFTKK